MAQNREVVNVAFRPDGVLCTAWYEEEGWAEGHIKQHPACVIHTMPTSTFTRIRDGNMGRQLTLDDFASVLDHVEADFNI